MKLGFWFWASLVLALLFIFCAVCSTIHLTKDGNPHTDHINHKCTAIFSALAIIFGVVFLCVAGCTNPEGMSEGKDHHDDGEKEEA